MHDKRFLMPFVAMLALAGCGSSGTSATSLPGSPSAEPVAASTGSDVSKAFDEVGLSAYPGAELVPGTLSEMGAIVSFEFYTPDSVAQVTGYYAKEMHSTVEHLVNGDVVEASSKTHFIHMNASQAKISATGKAVTDVIVNAQRNKR